MYLTSFMDLFAFSWSETSSADTEAEARYRRRAGGPESRRRRRRHKAVDNSCRRPFLVGLPADPDPDCRRPVGGREARQGRDTKPAVRRRAGGVRVRTDISHVDGNTPSPVRAHPTHRRPTKVLRSAAVVLVQNLSTVAVSAASASHHPAFPAIRTLYMFTLQQTHLRTDVRRIQPSGHAVLESELNKRRFVVCKSILNQTPNVVDNIVILWTSNQHHHY